MKKASLVKGVVGITFFFVLTTCIFILIKNRFPYGKDKVRLNNVIKHFPFSKENSLKEWEEKILKGKVVYRVEKGESLSYVRAKSEKAASALYYKVKLAINESPVLSWKWRVNEFPKRDFPEKIEDIKEEDFAARVYVIFPAAFFTGSKVIEYIWSETLPKSTCGTSGYSKNIKVLVLENGSSGEWRFEKRDIHADYVKLFSENPKLDIGAIAFMTDADSTKTRADAVYDEIEIGYK